MVYMLSITSLLVVLLEMTQAAPAPAPFLLDLLAPRITIRRQGKQIDDGYGVPEDSYGVPEEQVTQSSSYDAPKPQYSATTTTLPPCSYEAPTTTPAPSYGAPAAQKKGGFPDILGFIGDKIGDILKPRTENPQYGCLSPPVDSGYGAPQETSYEAPHSNAYEAPKSTAYEAPQSETYEAPQADTYEAPEKVSYDAPAGEEVDIAVNERNKEIVE